jgi:sugar phosphate permease
MDGAWRTNRWLMLAMGMAAQTATCVCLFGVPFLVPRLQTETGLSLSRIGLLVGAPSIGMVLTLIGWGYAADRIGERIVMVLGLAGCAGFLVAAAFVAGPVALGICLLLAGAAGASVNAASGRVVLGWFSREQRGLAMGWRQTAQPLGVALAAAALPPIAAHAGIRAALLTMAGIAGLTTVVVGLLAVDPPRSRGTPSVVPGNPYRHPVLWRIHGASALLVVPQFVVAAFALTYLIAERDFAAGPAGRLVALAGLGGAAARLVAGKLSDLVASRLRPMRWFALANCMVVGLLAAAAAADSPVGTALVLLACVVTVSTNGLAFTAVAENAGSAWAGRALGAQNTVQNMVSAATPAVFGAVIEGPGYAVAFAAAALCAVLAAGTTPRDPVRPTTTAEPAEPVGAALP